MASESDDFEIVDYDDIEVNNSGGESDFFNLEDREMDPWDDDRVRLEATSSKGEDRKDASGSIYTEYSSADGRLPSTDPKSKFKI